jgi:undecaprenyl-phosphate 4-deoxy-4-formamido-L-arabinose transferase
MAQKPEYDYEIICVNDCSPDSVFAKLRAIAGANERITVVDLAKNMGKHAAMMAGFSLVSGEIVVNLDDDGQCPIDRLWDLIDAISDNYDVAIAKYSLKKQSAFKNFGSSVNTAMSRVLLGKPYDLEISNFSVIKRFAIDEIIKYKNPYPYIEGLILRTTSKIVNVSMVERERRIGTGNFIFMKSLGLWLNGFTAFSVKPLRIATFIGIITAAIGFFYGAYIVVRKLIHTEIILGYSSTMAVLLFIGGILMLMLGLIGEYVGRIYISLNNSPQYVIRSTSRGVENHDNR